MFRRALALNILTLFKFSFVGYFQNLDNDCFLSLIAFLQSSFYHGLLFLGLLEVLGIHLPQISIREEVNPAMGSTESERDTAVKDSSHKE